MANVLTIPGKSIRPNPSDADLPIFAIDLPVVYEDEGQEEMGEILPHYRSEAFLYFGISAHLERNWPLLQALPDMNLYYHRIDRNAYLSPDVMVVEPYQRLPNTQRIYRIGEHGPGPKLTVEILSRRTAQQGDLALKPQIYADIGVAEYILVDITGEFLPERLRLLRLDPDKVWSIERDPDGGVTSALGFRIIMDPDGDVRVVDAKTGHRYARPDEAEAEARARLEAETGKLEADEARRQAEEARLEAEEARIEAVNAQRLAEQSQQEAIRERQEMEEAWRRALELTHQLDAELARLKKLPPNGAGQ